MRWNGETTLPKPVVLEQGKTTHIPSRDSNRTIPCRFFVPEGPDGKEVKPKGVFMHIHGGGWVLQSEAYQDVYLADLANGTGLTVFSVGYRLAPEDPYPAGNEDCFDAAEYLVDKGEEILGAPLKFVGGDSAGGHLSALVTFKLLETRPDFAFKGLVLNYGAFDLAGFPPNAHHFDMTLVLDKDLMDQ